jgi:hypothetical protein
MPSLKESLAAPEVRPRVIADCCLLIDQEVAEKSGLSGFAIKAAYGVVKAVKATIIADVLEGMLDDFVARLEPFVAAWSAAPSGTLATYLAARPGEVAESLLAISDARAQKTNNLTLRRAYEKLRPMGKKNVEQAVPRLSRLVEKYAAK